MVREVLDRKDKSIKVTDFKALFPGFKKALEECQSARIQCEKRGYHIVKPTGQLICYDCLDWFTKEDRISYQTRS